MRKVWQVVLAMFYLVLRMLAYLGLTILSLFGNTPPRRKLELWVVSIQDPRTAFYEPIIWLFVSITMAYATVTITDTIPKLICGILAFLFVLSFQRQFLTIEPLNSFQRFLSGFFLPILKKLENIFVLIFILLVFFGIVSWLNKDIQVLHLLPFSAILIYFIYVRTKFLPQQTEKGDTSEIYQVRHFINQLYFPTLVLLGFVLMLFVSLYTLNVLDTDVLSNVYSISATLYPVLLSIMAGFAVYFLKQENDKAENLKKPWLGLANMCVVFLLVTIIGLLFGTELQLGDFLEIKLFSEIWATKESVMMLFRVLLFEFILLSFPLTLMYAYAMLKTILHPPSIFGEN